MAEPQMVDPHDVVMTGENSFIRLSSDGGSSWSGPMILSDDGMGGGNLGSIVIFRLKPPVGAHQDLNLSPTHEAR